MAAFAIAILSFTVPNTKGEIQVSPVNNHRYQVIGASQWPAGQPLATVRSLEENAWIVDTFGMSGENPRALWIGLNDVAEEGTFTWVSGETNAFTNWAPSQPSNDSSKDHILIYPPDHSDAGKWGVFDSFGMFGVMHGAVLEYPPLPWVPPGVEWSFSPTGSYATQTADIALGADGVVYAVGYCGTNTFGSAEVTGFGGRDGYLARLDSNGAVMWVKNFGGAGTDAATGVAVDSEGNICVAGNFRDTADFGGTNLTASGTSDLFLSKYDASGALLWVVHAGSANITSQRVAVDAQDNIYVTGYFQGTADFGTTNLTSAGSVDVFLAKFDSFGLLQWVKQGEGSAAELSFRVAVSPSGESVITGRFNSSVCSFDSQSLTNSGALDLFVAKYDTDGNLLWARRDGGTANDWGNGVAISDSGDIYVTGFFHGISQFDSQSLTNLSDATYWDLFLAKYNTAGDLVWVKQEAGNRNDLGNDLACDSSGNVYLIFTVHGDAIIGDALIPNPGLYSRIGIVKYTSEGNVVWANFHGSPAGSDGLAIAVDDRGRAYYGGFWINSAWAVVGRLSPYEPRLEMQHLDGNVVLSWPTNFTGFTLETKSDLNTTPWTPLDTVPVLVVGHFVVTNELTGGNVFYRLRQAE